MKKLLLFTVLTALMMTCFSLDADAQSRKKKKKKKKPQQDEYFDESGNFASKLWYGAGGTLGFDNQYGISYFRIGITPMVGYKFTEKFSVGPRVGITYDYYKGETVSDISPFENTGRQGSGFISYSAGLFTRFKVLPAFFLHGEYGIQSFGYPDLSSSRIPYDKETDRLVSYRENQTQALLGAGYTSGGNGGLGYEISVLYDFFFPEENFGLPFVFRAGLNYQF